MAYDEGLADRIASYLADEPDVAERKMFGGIAFLVWGNMAVGISGDHLMVRLGREAAAAALSEPGTVPAEMGKGRPMRGWVLVEPDHIASDGDLAAWVDRGLAFAATFPPK